MLAISTITWTQVHPGSEPVDQAQFASALSTETVLEVVAWLGCLFGQRSTGQLLIERGTQIQIAHQLLSRSSAATVTGLLQRGEGATFLSEEQLLTAARLAVLNGLDRDPYVLADGATGELLLRINDELYPDHDTDDEARSGLVPLVLRQFGFDRNEQERYLLPRYFDLLITRGIPLLVDGQEQTPADLFTRALGISPQEYMACGLLSAAAFHAVSNVQGLRRASQQLDEWLRSLKKPELEHSMALYAGDRAGLKNAFAEYAISGGRTLMPFREKPLFRKADGPLIPVSVRVLLEKVAMGVYWELHKYFRERQQVGTLTAYLGPVFQSYLSDILDDIFRPIPNASYYPEASVRRVAGRKRAQEAPPFDAAIVEGDALILIEKTTTALPALLLEAGDPDKLFSDPSADAPEERKPDRKFVEKLRQLQDAVNELGTKWQIDDVDLRQIRTVYPVIALLHPFPQTPDVWARLRTAADDKWPEWPQGKSLGEGWQPVDVRIPAILTMEEMEMIEPLLRSGTQYLSGLLEAKLQDPNFAQGDTKTWLFISSGIDLPDNERLLHRFEEIKDELLATLGVDQGVSDAAANGPALPE